MSEAPTSTQPDKKDDLGLTPEEIEENKKAQQELEAHNEAVTKQMEDLKNAVRKDMPFVSKYLTLDEYKLKWEGNKFYDSFDSIMTKFSKVRELRRDGNCFYRAILWQIFEYFLVNKSEHALVEYDKILKKIEGAKQDLMDNGYDEVVVDMFHDQFLEEFKGLSEPKIDVTDDEAVEKYLEERLCDESLASYLITYIRFIISAYLKANREMYQPFIELDMDTYCQIRVDAVEQEAEEICIIGLMNYLDLAVEIIQVQPDGLAYTSKIPEDAVDDESRFIGRLLFTPGHYDSLHI
ncbi:unnamed protein product [Moneuplotes crassus]|uniref:ubiquitinyl hydrolase 1 n=1 Tax=Euplotes crassus TaxID=5936 RepID=A0AAD1XQS6_EUPCR|nr:unnamed protein product [Moneuplotes crassus]